MSLKDFFPQGEIESWQRMVFQFHDKLLLSDELTDMKALLICLYMRCNQLKVAEVKYSDVRALFLGFGRETNNFKVNLFNAKKQNLISDREENGSKLLSLTTKGLKSLKDLIGETVGIRTWVIEAGKVYSGKKLLQEIVQPNIGSSLCICDPYVSARTLDFLNSIGHKCKVSLLTQSLQDKSNFQRELKDFQKEFLEIEIEVRLF